MVNYVIYSIGGIIGNAQNVNVDLSNSDEEINLQRYCFTNKSFDTIESIKLAYSLIDLAEHSITIPLISISFLAPIYSLLKKEGILADFVLYVQGMTGVRKSSLTAVFLSLFGKFDRDSFPSTFRDTLNVIEQKSFILKDTLNVVDDFKPEQNMKNEIAILEGILAMYGDRVGRGRMNKDGQTRKSAYTARGLCIVTGETVPNVAQSRLARCIIVNVKKDSIDLKKLSYIQHHSEQLAFAMMQFIEFVIWKPNIEPIKQVIKKKYDKLHTDSLNYKLHGRTQEIGNILKLGFYLFTLFLKAYGVIDETTQKKLEADANITIDELLASQAQEIEESKPDNMFFSALEQLLSTKQIFLKDLKDKNSVSSFEKNEFAGFIDTDENTFYLLPDLIFNKVNTFYAQGNVNFPINAKTLWKYLCEEGFLEMYHPKSGRARYNWSKTVNGNKYSVIKIRIPETGDDTNDVLSNYAPPRDVVPRGDMKDNFVF